MSKVLVVQNFPVETPELIQTVLQDSGRGVQTIHTYLGNSLPARTDGLAGLVVMGGPMGVSESDRYPFIGQVLSMIDQCLCNQIPVLGICLGSQLLAHCLGSKIRRAPKKELGWFPVDLDSAAVEDPLFQDCAARFTALHWHGDIFDLPTECKNLASSEMTACQAFRYGKVAWGILFHMEVTASSFFGWTREFSSEIEAEGLDADALVAQADLHLSQLNENGAKVFYNWSCQLK